MAQLIDLSAMHQIRRIWIRAIAQPIRPVLSGGYITKLWVGNQEVQALDNWQLITCKPGSTLQIPGLKQGYMPTARHHLHLFCQIAPEDLVTIRALALPKQHKLVVIAQTAADQYILCPYQTGMTVLSPLWIPAEVKAGGVCSINLMGYAEVGILQFDSSILPGTTEYKPTQNISVQWAAERLPLEMIADAMISNL